MFPDGRKWDGKWKNGLPHGIGKFTTVEGDIIKGKWRNGRWIKWYGKKFKKYGVPSFQLTEKADMSTDAWDPLPKDKDELEFYIRRKIDL